MNPDPPHVRRLAEAVSAQVERGATVVVPVGSVEQHGPHLPLDTDTVIASAVAEAVAVRLDGWVAPAVAYGSSGEHQSFAGTVSIGTEAVQGVLVELGRSLSCWAGRVVYVNGHGGNVEAVRAAVELLRREGRDVAWAPCAVPGADAHAGRTETSLMLHLAADRVRLDDARAGNLAPVGELLEAMRLGGVAAVSSTGVLGDPTGATAAEGADLLTAMVQAALARIGGAGA